MGGRYRQRENGAALLLTLLILLLIGCSLLLSRQTAPGSAAMRNDAFDIDQLEQAKKALIAYAASHPTQPGGLPCPDDDGDGNADNNGINCKNYLGRLPWKTLDLPTLRDATGECLWYAVSKDYRSVLPANNRGIGNPPRYQLNDGLSGDIGLLDAKGTALPAGDSPAIAVIFVAGPELPGQQRTTDNTTLCGSNRAAANYLDSAQGIDNSAVGDAIAAGSGAQIILGDTASAFNDRIVWINRDQLFAAVVPRVLNTLRGSNATASGIVGGFGSIYPYAAATPKGPQQAGLLNGWLPYADLPAYPLATRRWLENNAWPERIAYNVNAARTQMTLSYNGHSLSCSGANTCP